jgi:signal transduction histidine kinase
LIEDLLDLHKMERGYLEIFEEPFSPGDLAERLSARISNQAEYSGLRYHVVVDKALPRFLVGDRLRIGQVVLNLLLNAFKFTKQGEVELNMKPVAATGSPLWAITVRDTGIGIPPEAQTLIFEPFRQLDGSLQREYGGSGLGLAISLQLCRRMGGDLTVQSVPGQGSTFTVLLPMKPYLSGREKTDLSSTKQRLL